MSRGIVIFHMLIIVLSVEKSVDATMHRKNNLVFALVMRILKMKENIDNHQDPNDTKKCTTTK